ncbi:UNVERIFIED_CONTAM: hypothetical protein PYX00_000219 [Menopon gallinae]|uniref:Clusterin-associated protein 1 n=1 Tax=Menopon gallinae TaxID=328185 RepID=A0AAW2I7N9_9NEOP
MSYRDLRNFIEMLKALGYSRIISMENFRTPNFPLVAEILTWLIKRIDSSEELPLEIGNENDRVALIRTAAQLLALKANLKLNTKKLYQADGYAVKELLKVTNLLYESLKIKEGKSNEEELPNISIIGTSLKLQDLKEVVPLVADIIKSGANLFDLLAKEAELRELRNSRASRLMEMTQVEQAIRDSLEAIDKDIEKTKQQTESLVHNESLLDSKLEKKNMDYDRHMKRLQTLKKIRPAFIEEFEKLEEELKVLYNDYVTKYRNIAYLESVLEQAEQTEQKRIQEKETSRSKFLEELKQDELFNSGDTFNDFADDNKAHINEEQKLKPQKFEGQANQRPGRVFGSMTGGMEDTDSIDDTDSDLLLDGDITEDEDIEVMNRPVRDFSDDDF